MKRERTIRWPLLAALAAAACGGSSERSKPDPETLIAEACDRVASLACPGGPQAAECSTALHEQRADAVGEGCAAEFDAVVACMASKLSQCGQSTQDVCEPEVEAFDQCEHPGGDEECSMASGGAPAGSPPGWEQCAIACSTWGMSCETDSSATLVCTCTAGPKAGTTFSVASCKDASSTLGAEHCAASP